MELKDLLALQSSSEAPFNHKDYTVWLHNKIVDRINFELWEFREKQSMQIKSSYAACNHVMSLPSLKRIG